MIRQTVRPFWAVTCLVWLLISGHVPLAAQQQKLDSLTVANETGAGTTLVTGTVIEANPDYVKIEEDSATKEIPVHRIQRLQFFDHPSGFSTIRSQVQSGQYQNALDQLRKLETPASVRDFVRQDIVFYEAYANAQLALQGGGDTAASVRVLIDFVRKHPKSLHYYRACETLGRLALYMGRNDAAAEYFRKLETAKADETKARGWLGQGEGWLRHADVAKALACFDQAAGLRDERSRVLGEIGRAICMAVEKKPEAGIDQLEKIIREQPATDSEMFARAYNALGICYEAAGKTEDAVLAFLHTDLLFGREVDLHAEALYHLSTLMAKINKPEEAAKSRQLLKSRYATTVWAKKSP